MLLLNTLALVHTLIKQISGVIAVYEGCSNMNASSFITFFTYMLRQNIIPFWKELFVGFKMAPNIKTHSLYFSSYRPLYKGHYCILKFFEAKFNARFGTRADIVSYLFNCELLRKDNNRTKVVSYSITI